jgi:hypothetical protein
MAYMKIFSVSNRLQQMSSVPGLAVQFSGDSEITGQAAFDYFQRRMQTVADQLPETLDRKAMFALKDAEGSLSFQVDYIGRRGWMPPSLFKDAKGKQMAIEHNQAAQPFKDMNVSISDNQSGKSITIKYLLQDRPEIIYQQGERYTEYPQSPDTENIAELLKRVDSLGEEVSRTALNQLQR